MLKKWLSTVIILLFILTSVSPMVFGFDSKILEKDEILENLAFVCYDEHGSSKLEYYKEYFKRDSSEIADLEEITISVESPQTDLSSGPMDSPWPMKSHDVCHTGRSSHSTVNTTAIEKWRFKCDWVEGGPVIDNNGIIYFGDFDYYLYALYPNGTLKWKYKTNDLIWSAPAIADDGTIYIGSYDCGLYAIYPNGSKKWRFETGGSISSSPVIAEDGTIYFGTLRGFDKGDIFAVNPDGTEKWRYPTGYYITSDPAIGDDGTIYIGSGDTYFYAMNPNGTLKWRFKTGGYIKGPPSITDDGTVYIGSYDDYLYALYTNNGTVKWVYKLRYGTETNPSITGDGTIYVGDDKLYAINPNGTEKWTFDLGTNRDIHKSSPAISSDGTIFVGTHIGDVDGGEIIAVNPDGTELWRKRIAYEWVESSPCIGEDGTVYIGCTTDWGGYLHAFGPVESNSPPETPTISGETHGKVKEKYWYHFTAIDPDNNPLSIYIDWGDDPGGWKEEHASGETCHYSHSWSEKGNYTIRCKAKDVLGEESDWAYLDVTMPKNKQLTNWWFLQFLEKHPRILPVLRHLVGL